VSSNGSKINKTPVAESIPFDNSANGFTADDVQAAIEEAGGDISKLEAIEVINTSAVTMTTSWQDISMEVERSSNPIYLHVSNSPEITVTQANRYLVIYNAGIQTTNANLRSQTEAKLVLNGLDIKFSGSEIYNRNKNQGGGNSSRSFILDLDANDVIKLQARRQSGGNTQKTIPGQSSITIIKLAGKKGDKGDKGDQGIPGQGSSVIIKDSGTLISGGPFTTLNFDQNLTATDNGSGEVLIEAAQNTVKYRQYLQYMKLGELNFDQYLVSYRDDDDNPRSGSQSNGFQFKQSGPILTTFSGTIIKANFAIKGIAQSTGTPASTVTIRFELWSVGFQGQGTKLSDIDVPIDTSTFTVGNFFNSFVDTDYKGSKILNISVPENTLVALKFNSITGNANAVTIREVVATLTLEEI